MGLFQFDKEEVLEFFQKLSLFKKNLLQYG